MKTMTRGNTMLKYLLFCLVVITSSLILSADNAEILSLSCDEGTGLPQDGSGYGNHPTSMVADWVAGKYDYGLVFDGKDSFVSIPGTSASLNGVTTELTLEAWIYPTGDIGPEKAGLYGIVTKENVWSLFLHYGYPALAVRVVGPGPKQFLYVRSKKGISANRWYHVAGTYNAATRTSKIYLDGVETAGQVFDGYADYEIQAADAKSSRVLIGRYLYNGSPFQGLIDEVTVSAREKLTFNLGTGGAAASNRETTVGRFSTAPRLDGRLDDPAWDQAAVLKDFWKNTGTGPADRPTVCYAGYDEENFYVGFRCYDDDLGAIKADARSRDQPDIFNDDCVEIFLSPTGRQNFYYHLAVTAGGVVYDGIMNDGAPVDWDGAWSAATGREKDAWTAEVRIPFCSLRPVAGVTDWRINLCRERPRSAGREVSCWSCTYGGFHKPEKFGLARGIKTGDDYFLDVSGFCIGRYAVGSGGGIVYNVDLVIKNNAAEDKDLIVDLEDIPSGGGASVQARAEGRFPVGREKPVRLSVPVPVMGDRRVVLRIRDKRNRVLLYSLYQPTTFPKLLDCHYERSYYSDEPAAGLVVQVNAEDGLLKGLSAGVKMEDAGGADVYSRRFPISGRREFIGVNIEDLAVGRYTGRVSLSDFRGNVLATEDIRLDKLAKVDGEVKINEDKSCLMVGGRDYFLLGLWEGIAPESIWDEVARSGFNTIIAPGLTGWGDADVVKYLTRARENNLKAVLYAGKWGARGFGGDGDGELFIRESVPVTVDKFRDHPALLAWESFDEPYPRVRPEVMDRLYRCVKQHDPYHPVWVTFAKDVPGGDDWRRSWDILAPDIYLRLSEGQNPASVIPYVVKAVDRARQERKPVVAVLMGQDWEFTNRAITPAEQVCETYLCCLYGARGVAYWYNNPIVYQPLWEVMKRTAGELRILSPVLLAAPESEVTVRKESDPRGIVHVLARRWDGKLYVIAVNTGEGRARVKFDFSGTACGVRGAQVMFEERKLAGREKSFEDDFDKYARHVYVLPADPVGVSGPDFIAVSLLDFQAEVKRPLYEVRPERPNIVFNSSFEITTNPGWPDGWSKWCGFDPKSPAWFPRIGEKNANLALDTGCHYDGKQSLLLSQTRDGRPLSLLETNARPVGRGKYVYSVYLKGDRNDLPVKLWVRYGSWAQGVPEKTVKVTTEWQRYFFNIDIGEGRSVIFCGLSIMGEGTVWADALQLETGETATPYLPAERVAD